MIDYIECQSRAWSVPEEIGELRVALIGAGKMARLHLETLKGMSGIRLHSICSRSRQKAQALAQEFSIEQVYDNIDQLLQSGPDAVIVAVSHSASSQVARQVLDAGVPCLLEKPAGYSSSETAQLLQIATSKGCLNMVGVNRRYYSVVQSALLAVMQYGPIRGVLIEAHEPLLEYRSRRQFEEWLYENWLLANSIHAIDLFRMVGGEVMKLSSRTGRACEARADQFSATMTLSDGVIGTFVAHWNSGGGIGMKIYGDYIVADLMPLETAFLHYATGRQIKLRPDWADTTFKPGLYAQNTAFLQAVCDGQPPSFPASDLRDHLETIRLIERFMLNQSD